MKRIPIIGVTSSIDDERRQFINRDYLTGLHSAGVIPMVLSFGLSSNEISMCLDRLDGLFLSGGNDIDPILFGESPAIGLGTVSPMRDKLEMAIILEAYQRSMPIFAICRGIQSLNVALGGTLYQDLPSQYASPTNQPLILHSQTTLGRYASHAVSISEGTPLHAIFNADTLAVNSFHHQAIKAVSPQLTICALASDGVIEAVFASDKPFVLGVQWHPERMEEGIPLFQAFTKACDVYAAGRLALMK